MMALLVSVPHTLHLCLQYPHASIQIGKTKMRNKRDRFVRRCGAEHALLYAPLIFTYPTQVHEKSLLLPLCPLAFLWADAPMFTTWLQVRVNVWKVI